METTQIRGAQSGFGNLGIRIDFPAVGLAVEWSAAMPVIYAAYSITGWIALALLLTYWAIVAHLRRERSVLSRADAFDCLRGRPETACRFLFTLGSAAARPQAERRRRYE